MSNYHYTISDNAYTLITMHATKYTHGLSGILLGRKTSSQVEITTALPFAHSDLTLQTTPLTETALHLSEQIANIRNMTILGLYYANSNPNDRSIGTVPTHIADLIRSRNPQAVLLIINAKQLAPSIRLKAHCFNVYVKQEQDGTWARGVQDPSLLSVSRRALVAADAIMKGKLGADSFSYTVADFEDHCADPTCDWLNAHIVARLHDLLSTVL